VNSKTKAIAGTLAAILVVGWLWSVVNRPPQIGVDEEVFQTVDALFTAVTARDAALLADCERRLQEYQTAGTLPRSAGERLDEIIELARAGSWRPSAEQLYALMLAQRR